MQPGSNRFDRNLTHRRDLLVAEAARFAKKEDVPLHIRQVRNRSSERQSELLSRWNRRLAQRDHHRPAPAITQVIQGEISRDPEQPSALSDGAGVGHTGSGDSQEDFLRQVASRFRRSNDAAQVSVDAVMMVGEQSLDVGHS
jgi:hypothetical protein